MNEAGPSHNLNENLGLHDIPVINDEVLDNSESDGDDDNDNIQSSFDDVVNDDTNLSKPIADSLHVINECVSRDMANWIHNAVANEYFIENEETEWMRTTTVQVGLRIDGEPAVAAPQLWCWERFHVARLIPRPPLNPARDACFGARWNVRVNTILEPPTLEEDESQWRQWYERQSNLYLTLFSEEPPTEYCPRGPIKRTLVDVTFRTRELLITNPEASYLDVKKEILKLQEDTFNKLRIKIPKYEQPSIPSGAEYTPGESSGGPNTWAHLWTLEQWPNVYDAQSRGISQMDLQMSQWTQDFGVLDALTPIRVLTPPPHIIERVHIHDQGTQLTPHMEEKGEDNDETQPLRRIIRGRGKHVISKKKH
ncbi:hypothetical protein Taro_006171 [Colocasia esculenta]|uniref:Uncharacterized protein n=1 Tax=Colocasia esculenta TaxID=4460 RepID=A0A843TWL9_COLES|nr:hypothetical protein [Colocasia esculenta]